MIAHNWFESWFNSPYYKILYQNRDHQEADDFSDALLAYLQPMAGSRMVDIGCGEGRFSVQFAQKGFDVVGIDLAGNSIAKALTMAHDKLHFFVHDMRLPFYINYFDYAFNLFTSFGYFAKERDNHLAASAFAKGLRKGGHLVIDYLNRDFVLANMKAEETIVNDGIRFEITKNYDGKHIIKHIKFEDRAGVAQHFTERVSAFTQEDIYQLFAAVGLRQVAVFGNYQLAEYNEQASPRLIMVFVKD